MRGFFHGCWTTIGSRLKTDCTSFAVCRLKTKFTKFTCSHLAYKCELVKVVNFVWSCYL